MNVLRIQVASGGLDVGARIAAAADAFNRGLDIRLRFLAIGIAERELRLDDEATAAERTAAALVDFAPDTVLLLGEGAAALAAARVVAGTASLLVRVGAGCRTGVHADAATAIDRLSAVLFTHGDDAVHTLVAEGLEERVVRIPAAEDADVGVAIIEALRRRRRRGAGG